MGLPDLSPADAEKVRLGNICCLFCMRVALACLHARVPGAFENPWTSWVWKLPQVQAVVKRPYVRLVRTDFCQFGMPWRKATNFMCLFCDTAPIERICRGHGICTRTHMPHLELKGTIKINGADVFLTHVAEPYPKTLCTRLVRMLQNACLASQAEILDSMFCKLC